MVARHDAEAKRPVRPASPLPGTGAAAEPPGRAGPSGARATACAGRDARRRKAPPRIPTRQLPRLRCHELTHAA